MADLWKSDRSHMAIPETGVSTRRTQTHPMFRRVTSRPQYTLSEHYSNFCLFNWLAMKFQ